MNKWNIYDEKALVFDFDDTKHAQHRWGNVIPI